jgi:hypothetical protein
MVRGAKVVGVGKVGGFRGEVRDNGGPAMDSDWGMAVRRGATGGERKRHGWRWQGEVTGI